MWCHRILFLSFVSGNVEKTKPLLELPGAKEQLSIWRADLSEEGSFDEAIAGCTGVFHVATPMDFESKDPEVSRMESIHGCQLKRKLSIIQEAPT
jgi:hypothetical protein